MYQSRVQTFAFLHYIFNYKICQLDIVILFLFIKNHCSVLAKMYNFPVGILLSFCNCPVSLYMAEQAALSV